MNTKKLVYRIILWCFTATIGFLLLAVSLIYLFKDKIIAASIGEINKYLNTKVDINPAIDLSLFDKFPQVAIGFKDVKIYESTPGSTQLLGRADNLYLTLNILTILDGQYIINKLYLENGDFHLKVNKEGETNYNIFKKDSSKTAASNKGVLDLTDISLKNVLVKYEDESTKQYYEVLSKELHASFALDNDIYKISLQGPQQVNTIRINEGEYFKGKSLHINSQLRVDNNEKLFTILQTSIKIGQSEYTVKGSYAYKNKNVLDIAIENKKGDIYTLLSLLPQNYYDQFSAYKSEGEIYFNASIKGTVSKTENPAVNVNFGCKKATFYHPELKKKLNDANFYGIFSNGDNHSLETSVLKLENIRFDFDEKMVQGNFLYRNFNNPYIAFDATGNVSAASILNFYSFPTIKSASGSIDFDVDFKGLLNDLKTKEGHSRIETAGEITITDINISPTNIPFSLNQLNGTFLFNKNDIAVTDFTAKIGKSDFTINGILKNLFGALFLDNGRMLSDIEVKASYWDVEELLTLQNKSETEEDTETVKPQKGTFPYLEKYICNLALDIKKIAYKKVMMNQFSGSLHFEQPLLNAENIRFRLANGDISVNSSTVFKSSDVIETSINSSLKVITIDSLLYMFDNFGQDFITYKNIKGEYTGTIETFIKWNSNGEIDTKSLVANIDCSILKGELIDFEPMQNLAKFIDAQELAHIKFSEIKNKLFIENRKISFPEMQIISNVSDISFSGTHTFDNVMDYKLAVPLKNLKKPKIDKDAAFGSIEEDTKKGSTLFLTIKGTADNYKIGYDTKRTKEKISKNLKKEKVEFLNLFKKKEKEIQETVKPNQEEFFDFGD